MSLILEKMNKMAENISSKRKFVWNMIGSMSNALASFVLLTIVTRINGSEDGGLFSLAFSTAQMLTSIGCFETRALQVTDIGRKQNFKDYFTFRVMTSLLMMAALVVYVLVSGKTGESAAVIFFICLYKAIDCVSDSFQGLFQLSDRIDLSGMALGLRVMLSTLVFGLTLAGFHSLLWSAIAMCITELIFIFFFDYQLSKRYDVCGLQIRPEAVKSLFLQCFPLFIGSFMVSYMVNASRYAIDELMTNEIQNYYGFLLMPAFVINLFSLFVFRPMLTPMAVCWSKRDKKEFFGMIRKSMLWIGFLTVGAVAGAWLLGIPILNLVSGLELDKYRVELVIVMLGGSMNAVITVCYYILAVMRRQYQILAAYGVGFAAALVIPRMLVQAAGITGAVISYVIPMTLAVVTFWIEIIWNVQKTDWSNSHE